MQRSDRSGEPARSRSRRRANWHVDFGSTAAPGEGSFFTSGLHEQRNATGCGPNVKAVVSDRLP